MEAQHMKINITKNWCMRMATLEGDAEIGAGPLAFVLSDRQWPRHLRIAHARWQMKNATTPEVREFWRKIISLLGAATDGAAPCG